METPFELEVRTDGSRIDYEIEVEEGEGTVEGVSGTTGSRSGDVFGYLVVAASRSGCTGYSLYGPFPLFDFDFVVDP